MKNLAKTLLVASIALVTPISGYASGDHGEMSGHDMKKMDHSKMDMGGKSMSKSMIMGNGVINSVDVDKQSINISHEPIAAISWPKMTMDIPVTKKVNLSDIKAGDNVSFMLKLGRDKVYRITKISASSKNGHEDGHSDH